MRLSRCRTAISTLAVWIGCSFAGGSLLGNDGAEGPQADAVADELIIPEAVSVPLAKEPPPEDRKEVEEVPKGDPRNDWASVPGEEIAQPVGSPDDVQPLPKLELLPLGAGQGDGEAVSGTQIADLDNLAAKLPAKPAAGDVPGAGDQPVPVAQVPADPGAPGSTSPPPADDSSRPGYLRRLLTSIPDGAVYAFSEMARTAKEHPVLAAVAVPVAVGALKLAAAHPVGMAVLAGGLVAYNVWETGGDAEKLGIMMGEFGATYVLAGGVGRIAGLTSQWIPAATAAIVSKVPTAVKSGSYSPAKTYATVNREESVLSKGNTDPPRREPLVEQAIRGIGNWWSRR